jgi:hypothetical protein
MSLERKLANSMNPMVQRNMQPPDIAYSRGAAGIHQAREQKLGLQKKMHVHGGKPHPRNQNHLSDYNTAVNLMAGLAKTG